MKIPVSRSAVLALALATSGCATFQPQRGVDAAASLLADRGQAWAAVADGQCADPPPPLAALLAAPLTDEAAVQVALLCNPGIAAAYARMGIANADAFEAARLSNPSLSLGVADKSGAGGGTRVSVGIAQNFTELILRGPRTRLAEGEFLRAQHLLAGSILELVADVRAETWTLIGAVQLAQAHAAIAEAMDASAELSARFHAAGNISARELALARAQATESRIAARIADEAAVAARAGLQRALGLDAAIAWEVIDSFALPSDAALDPSALRAQADLQRLDLAAARVLVERLADSAHTTRRLRWLGEFEVGIDYEREPDHSRLIGPTLSIQLPLFQRGQGALARAESMSAWSRAERRRLTLEVSTSVELAARRLDAARARVDDHRLHLLPQRAIVVARMQEEVNFMLRGAFELIAARRDELEAAAGYFEALRDYWIAHAELERAVGARITVSRSGRPIRAAEVLRVGTDAPEPIHDHGAMTALPSGDGVTPASPKRSVVPDRDGAAHRHDQPDTNPPGEPS